MHARWVLLGFAVLGVVAACATSSTNNGNTAPAQDGGATGDADLGQFGDA